MTVKCPKCRWKGSNAAYMKHYASKHYKKKKGKAKSGKVKTAKIPVWARKRR